MSGNSLPEFTVYVKGRPVPEWLEQDLGISSAIFDVDRVRIGFTDGGGFDTGDEFVRGILHAWFGVAVS